MTIYRVRATMHGGRLVTDKFWLKRKGAQAYADETNKYHPGANARVVKNFPWVKV